MRYSSYRITAGEVLAASGVGVLAASSAHCGAGCDLSLAWAAMGFAKASAAMLAKNKPCLPHPRAFTRPPTTGLRRCGARARRSETTKPSLFRGEIQASRMSVPFLIRGGGQHHLLLIVGRDLLIEPAQ